jgi:hypothetical protein
MRTAAETEAPAKTPPVLLRPTQIPHDDLGSNSGYRNGNIQLRMGPNLKWVASNRRPNTGPHDSNKQVH